MKNFYYVRYRKVRYCDCNHYKLTHDICDWEQETEVSDTDFLKQFYLEDRDYYNAQLIIVDKYVKI